MILLVSIIGVLGVIALVCTLLPKDQGKSRVVYLRGKYHVGWGWRFKTRKVYSTNNTPRFKWSDKIEQAFKFDTYEEARECADKAQAEDDSDNEKPVVVKAPVVKAVESASVVRVVRNAKDEAIGVYDSTGKYIDLTSKESDRWVAGNNSGI